MKLFLAAGALFLLSAFQDPPDFEAELKSLKSEYKKAQDEYYRPYQEAKTQEEIDKIKLDPSKEPGPTYLKRFKDLAERAKGTEAAAGAHLEAFQLALGARRTDDARASMETLLASHLESPVMERFASALRYAGYQVGEPACRKALATIQEKSPHAKAKASATYILAIQGMATREKESREEFARLKKEFGDTSYARKADAYLFEMDYLQIGKVAPDFEATDEKGEKYKLSDYRGKVVVLDFWGFW